MSHEIESVPVHFKLEVGNNHNAEINTTVVKGTEVVYFTGGLVGAIKGMSDASTFLEELLYPDGASSQPDGLKIFAAAGKSARSRDG